MRNLTGANLEFSSNASKRRRLLALASLCLSWCLNLNTVGASAQESGLGLDQDSLLPPEVIPLDPAAANKMVQTQTQSRALQPAATSEGQGNVPGLSGVEPLAPTQSAQDFRKSMFDYASNQYTANQLHKPASMQALQSMQGQMANQQPGNGQLGEPSGHAPNGQVSQSSDLLTATAPPQSQTLSGSPKAPKGRGSKLNGLKHGLGLATTLGTGVLVGGMAARSGNPYAALGLGLYGANMLRYGARNSFRYW